MKKYFKSCQYKPCLFGVEFLLMEVIITCERLGQDSRKGMDYYLLDYVTLTENFQIGYSPCKGTGWG